MAKIKVTDLQNINVDRQTSYINDLDIESASIFGGKNDNFSELVRFGVKSMEFILLAYAIDSISTLATSFNNS